MGLYRGAARSGDSAPLVVWRLCLWADRSCREKAQHQQLHWGESLPRHSCSNDRADASVRRPRRRLLHAAKWWVSRPDNARVASLRGDAGTQPLVHSCCPLWETSRSCPFIYAVLVMQNDSTMFILLNCLLDVARRMSLNGIAGSQIPGENAPRRQANQGWTKVW